MCCRLCLVSKSGMFAVVACLQGIRYVEKHRGELQLPVYVAHGSKDAVTDINVSKHCCTPSPAPAPASCRQIVAHACAAKQCNTSCQRYYIGVINIVL